eukprot:TRINITY_DN107424_c0_g1_i1.p1 TRINITY_DN107424_c0_g1~~TRINITY_DN107424_c0_g1_i1.p1  ORF type:complete len:485 (+),score=80.68 TRINITY_DN107424_c0_g1_i1:112-1566(+)
MSAAVQLCLLVVLATVCSGTFIALFPLDAQKSFQQNVSLFVRRAPQSILLFTKSRRGLLLGIVTCILLVLRHFAGTTSATSVLQEDPRSVLSQAVRLADQVEETTDAPWRRAWHPELQAEDLSSVGKLEAKQRHVLPDHDGMMFVNGVRVNGKVTWAARVCTQNCYTRDCNPSDPCHMDSQVVVGELQRAEGGGNASWSWMQAKPLEIRQENPSTDGITGPEDPRLEVVQGRRFAITHLLYKVPDKYKHLCRVEALLAYRLKGSAGKDVKKDGLVRRPLFVPIDSFPASPSQCFIHVPERLFEHCQVEKNWVSIVPKDSRLVFLVRSLQPLQVLAFDPDTCEAHSVEGGQKRPDISDLRSSTRYVHGVDVEEGAVFWAVAHTPRPEYFFVLVAILVRSTSPPQFELLGWSCKFPPGDLVKMSEGSFAYPNGILGFDRTADNAEITIHVDDAKNFLLRVKGIRGWLEEAYGLWRASGTFRCDLRG